MFIDVYSLLFYGIFMANYIIKLELKPKLIIAELKLKPKPCDLAQKYKRETPI